MADQSLALEWRNYKFATKSIFSSLYKDESLADVTLVCEDNKKILAHKFILQACSHFFHDILVGNPNPRPLIHLQGVQLKHMELIKQFMYLGQAKVGKEDIETFVAVSERLMNTDGRQSAKDDYKLQINVENVKLLPDVAVQNEPPCEIKSEIKEQTNDTATKPSKNLDTLKQKMMTNKSKQELYLCELCSYSTRKQNTMWKHKNQHLGIKYQCDQCMSAFRAKTTLEMHYDTKHADTTYPCDKCDFKADGKIILRKHDKKKDPSRNQISMQSM